MSVELNDTAGWWNAVIAPLITGYCPENGKEFDMGTSNICPHCHGSTSGPHHWKWFNPDEELPTP